MLDNDELDLPDFYPMAQPKVKCWSPNRKKEVAEVVLRLMSGEPVDDLASELGIEIYSLEEWHQKAFKG